MRPAECAGMGGEVTVVGVCNAWYRGAYGMKTDGMQWHGRDGLLAVIYMSAKAYVSTRRTTSHRMGD